MLSLGARVSRCVLRVFCVKRVNRPPQDRGLPPFYRPRSGQEVQRWGGKVKELVEQSTEPSSFFPGRRRVSPPKHAGVVADRRYSAAVCGTVAMCGSCTSTGPCPG